MTIDFGLLLHPVAVGRAGLEDTPGRDPSWDAGERPRYRAMRPKKRAPVQAVPPSAYDLLSAVLRGQVADSLQIIQFIPLTGRCCARPVAAAFAGASAAAFGRTLLLDISGAANAERRQDFGSLPADAEALALRRAMIPDMVRPGLHHASASPRCLEDLKGLIARVIRSTAAQASPFRMIVLDETTKLAREHALMLSMGCTATVPIAVAGESRLPDMRETVRRLRIAGASLTGLVLVHAQDDRGTGGGHSFVPRC